MHVPVHRQAWVHTFRPFRQMMLNAAPGLFHITLHIYVGLTFSHKILYPLLTCQQVKTWHFLSDEQSFLVNHSFLGSLYFPLLSRAICRLTQGRQKRRWWKPFLQILVGGPEKAPIRNTGKRGGCYNENGKHYSPSDPHTATRKQIIDKVSKWHECLQFQTGKGLQCKMSI